MEYGRANGVVQLDYSLLSLIGTVADMVVIYLVPPAAVFYGLAHGHYNIAIIGSVSWAVMARPIGLR